MTFNVVYSTDGGKTFQPYVIGTSISLGYGDTLDFKTDGTSINTEFSSGDNRGVRFQTTGLLEISGSLGYMLDENNGANAKYDFAWYMFKMLFSDQTSVTGFLDLSFIPSGKNAL